MPQSKKVLLIVNPIAGKRKMRSNIMDVLHAFSKHQYLTATLTTTARGDAAEYVERYAAFFDLIVCGGGDGTLNEIISGLIKSRQRTPIAYIPVGTTNDMARTLSLPRSVKKSTQVVLQGEPVAHDVGTFNETQYFSYTASFGAFTKVSYATPQWLKRHFGHFAYVLDTFASMGDLHPYHAKVTCEGFTTEDDFIFGSITNATSVGGVLHFNRKDVCLNDGKFEVLLVRNPRNPLELRNILHGLMHKKYDARYVFFLHASQIHLEFDKMTAWTVDGEFAGDTQTVDISNQQGAVQIIRLSEKKSQEPYDST